MSLLLAMGSGPTTFTREDAETVSLPEALARQVVHILQETVGLSESTLGEVRHRIVDEAALTEILSVLLGKALVETLDLTDNVQTILLKMKQMADPTELTEALTRHVNIAVSEALGIQESVPLEIRKTMAETVGLTEAVQQQIRTTVSDFLGLLLIELLVPIPIPRLPSLGSPFTIVLGRRRGRR